MSEINKNKPGYKHTPLGWIPEEWEIKKFGEIVSSSQYGLSKASSDGGRYKIIGMKNIQRGELVTEECATVNLKEEEFEKYKLLPDDFLFNRTNSYDLVGKSVLIEFDPNSTFASYLIRFKLNKRKVVPKFVCYFFNTDKSDKKLKAIATKAVSQANINPTVLQRIFEVLIPPLPEQQKIATILSTWDEAIAKTQQLIAQLQQRNKGLMQQLLTGKKRLKGFEERLNNLIPINLFAKEVSEKNKEDKELIVLSCTKYNGLVPSLEYFGRKIYSDDLTTYKIVSKKCFAYATNHIEEGSIGFQSEYEQALISPMYTVFKTDNSVNDEYLFKVLKSHHYIHEYQKRMEGSIDRRGGLRWNEFSKIKVLIPLIEEQKAIAGILNKADDEVKLNQQKFAALQQQKKGLMQKLLTGEVRIKV